MCAKNTSRHMDEIQMLPICIGSTILQQNTTIYKQTSHKHYKIDKYLFILN